MIKWVGKFFFDVLDIIIWYDMFVFCFEFIMVLKNKLMEGCVFVCLVFVFVFWYG